MSAADGDSGDSFRGLVLQLRGRIGLTQRELASRLDVHSHSVQAWEAGTSYPGAASLRGLIAVALQAGGFTSGDEVVEAAALWSAAMRESSRLRTPFDRAWFDGLLSPDRSPRNPAPSVAAPPVAVADARGFGTRRHSWGEAPDVSSFVGRTEECERLRSWVLDDRCRVAGLYGLAGIGKTLLAACLAHEVAPHFEYVYWRSLRDAPAPTEWLAAALAFLAPNDAPVAGEAAQAMRLLELLSRSRCLLIVDNFETVLSTGTHDGYASLLRQLGEVPHQSCLLLTSREAPAQLELMRGERSPVRSLHLAGFGVDEGRDLLNDKVLDGDAADWQALVAGCGGNGLALKVTGETIRDLFGSSIASYLDFAASTPGLMIGGLREMLAVQVERLSSPERHLLHWLAVEREPVSFVELATELGPRIGRGAALEAIEGLRRRSLLERGERQARFTLHPVVLEYVTEQLIETIGAEIRTGDLDRLLTQPLMKATARDYVRRGQERLIAAPLLNLLTAAEGNVERRLLALLDQLRGRRRGEQGYGPGNLVNLLRLSRGHLRGVDLSGLEIRQAFLQGVEAQDASLAGARLAEAVLAEAFQYPTSVTLSADGAYLAAGTSASEICLWRVADRTLLATLSGHTGAIRGIALSRDNQLVVSGSFDGTVRLWEAESGRSLAIMRGHEGLVYAVALSGDGALAASGSQDGTVKLWETATGRLLATLPGHTGGVWGVAMNEDGRVVVSGSFDGTVSLWDAASGRLLRTLSGHTGSVLGVAISADGTLVASGSFDGTVRLWDAESGEPLATLEGHAAGVRDVALSDDGRLVASGSLDGTVRLWDTGSGRLLTTLRGHVSLVYTVALSGDGLLAASGSFDGTVKLWDSASSRLLANLRGYNRGIRTVAVSGDGRLVASGGYDGDVLLWDGERGDLLRKLHGHASGIRGVAISADGRLVASGSFDGTIKLWDSGSGRLLATLPAHTGGIWGVALSGDGQLVVSGGYDGAVKLWDANSGRLLRTLEGHASSIRAVALTGDGRLAASGSEDKTIRLWDTTSGHLLASLEGHTGGIWDVALSDDGRLVASCADDRTVRLWETETGRLLKTLDGHTNAVWGVALSEDGRLVASGSFDGTIRLWGTETGAHLTTMEGHDGRVVGVAMDAAGRVAASAGTDGTVRVWEPRSGLVRQTLRADRPYERLDITGLTGLTDAQYDALLVLGAVDHGAGIS